MKKTISTGLVLVCLGLTTLGKKAVSSARELSYTIDFVLSKEFPGKGDLEVKKKTDRVRVLAYKYDEYDLPVPNLGKDQEVEHALRLKTNAGQPSINANPIINHKTKPIL